MTGMILAGGKSSRMGDDKALLKFGEASLLEHLAWILAPLFKEVLILVDEKEKLKHLSLGEAKVYQDFIKHQGPLGGIYTGLLYAQYPAACVLTCDMPLIDEQTLCALVGFWEEEYDLVSLEEPEGNYHPFPAVYGRPSRHLMRFLLNRGENSMRRFLECATVKPLTLQEERIRVMTNMNFIEDYYKILKEKDDWAKRES